MFDLHDIIEIAVQLEANSESTYRQAARQALNPEVGALLSRLAEEEAKHRGWFTQLREEDTTAKKVDASMEKFGRELMTSVLKGRTFSLDQEALSLVDNQEKVLRVALEFENDTILFYQMIGAFIENAQVLANLDAIIYEERNHIRVLEGWLATLSEGGSVFT